MAFSSSTIKIEAFSTSHFPLFLSFFHHIIIWWRIGKKNENRASAKFFRKREKIS
ncbi:hypothetical protein D068_cds35030 [Bacillus atrophaeus UCMB-5137]|nr:hypothetical protein D068_cds35030 [Bacillus atrophaeus UCMB-5137]